MSIINFENTKYFEIRNGVNLECGKKLKSAKMAYETYGSLNDDKSNAILIFHALSGSAHVYKNGTNLKGWWDSMIGPKRPFDTTKYFIICTNILGSCYGSTGPNSIDPRTDEPYGINFPLTSVHDMVKVQKQLIDYLKIKELLAITGGSLGGMQSLDWAISYPDSVRAVMPIATTLRTSAQNIAFHEVGRQAIYSDPFWNKGNYYKQITKPDYGLSVARMVGHITYLSQPSMRERFGRKFRENINPRQLNSQFQVESYLAHKGLSFTRRFDANSYIYITKAIDLFDLGKELEAIEKFKKVKSRFLVISFSSDWLYPTYQSRRIVSALNANQIHTSFCEINSSYGHDAFLLPSSDGIYEKIITDFLKTSYQEEN